MRNPTSPSGSNAPQTPMSATSARHSKRGRKVELTSAESARFVEVLRAWVDPLPSQGTAAKQLGISQQQLSSILLGKRRTSRATALRLQMLRGQRILDPAAAPSAVGATSAPPVSDGVDELDERVFPRAPERITYSQRQAAKALWRIVPMPTTGDGAESMYLRALCAAQEVDRRQMNPTPSAIFSHLLQSHPTSPDVETTDPSLAPTPA